VRIPVLTGLLHVLGSGQASFFQQRRQPLNLGRENLQLFADGGFACLQLPYKHFSVLMRPDKRLAAVTGVGIDGGKRTKKLLRVVTCSSSDDQPWQCTFNSQRPPPG
jgi:hypothetical protein